jgi:antitoxin component YwqK of YwqJK toxin-antitoxin module
MEQEINKLDGKYQKQGPWKTFFKNGNPNCENNYINGTVNGYAKAWYESGDLAWEGDYVNGVRHGFHKNYFINGLLNSENFYKTERKTHPSFLRGWDVSD